jgi:hypothetical protein
MTFSRSYRRRLASFGPRFLSRTGQTTIEYLLTTMMILVLFTTMYRFLQGQTRKLFTAASQMILRAYY